jgi:plastocyanin
MLLRLKALTRARGHEHDNAMIKIVSISLISILAVVIIGGSCYVATKQHQTTVQPEPKRSNVPLMQTSQSAVAATSSSVISPTVTAPIGKVFTITGSNYSFSPAQITVQKNDIVKIIFKNAEGTHDLVMPDFNIATKQLTAGNSETIQFIATKTGAFDYYCSVSNHRAMGMIGKIIIQ